MYLEDLLVSMADWHKAYIFDSIAIFVGREAKIELPMWHCRYN